MKNLEIKVKVDNLNEIKQKITFAVYDGMLEQKDIYFLTGDIKIKTREEVKCDELIIYIRKMKKGQRFLSIIVSHLQKSSSVLLKNCLVLFSELKLLFLKNENCISIKILEFIWT